MGAGAGYESYFFLGALRAARLGKVDGWDGMEMGWGAMAFAFDYFCLLGLAWLWILGSTLRMAFFCGLLFVFFLLDCFG
jgi:hypothetical protein